MAPSDRPGRRDPVFGDPEGQRPAQRGPRFTLDDDDSADLRNPDGARRPDMRVPDGRQGDMRADARDDAVWRARTADYDELYDDGPGRPPYLIIGVIVAVLGVAGSAWYFYNRNLDRVPVGPPPLITAEVGPTKIAPEQPGGAVVPNQDKMVYARIAGERYPEQAPGQEELLSKPEEPKRLPPKPAPVVAAADPQPAGPRGLSQAELAAQVRTQAPVEITSEKAAKGLANANDAAPPPPTRGAGTLEAPKGMTAVRPTGEAAAILGVQDNGQAIPATAGQAAQNVQAQPAPPVHLSAPKPAPAPAPAPIAAKPAAPAPAAGGNGVVQLGALPDEDMVDREWDRLVKKHADLLGGLKKSVVEVDVPGKGTLYRLRVSGLKDAKAANELCTKLKARNQPCLVP
jgi:hypothetical protein